MERLGVARRRAELRPAVASWGPGRLDVFVRGTDNTIFQRTFDAHNWFDWTRIGEPWAIAGLPGLAAVALPASESIDLLTWMQFPPQPEAYLAHKSFCAGRWKYTLVLGDIFAVPAAPASTSTSLAVASWRFNYHTLDWFMRGADNTLMHSAGFVGCGGDVSSLHETFGPTSRGGFLTSGPAAVAVDPGRIDIVVRGGDSGLWHIWLPTVA
jgi:hypothetical protein